MDVVGQIEERRWSVEKCLVARQGIGLGHTAGVGLTCRTEAGVHDVVAGTVSRAPGELVAHLCERWMGEVVLSTSGLI